MAKGTKGRGSVCQGSIGPRADRDKGPKGQGSKGPKVIRKMISASGRNFLMLLPAFFGKNVDFRFQLFS